jgi:Tn3 transposase DDE domain
MGAPEPFELPLNLLYSGESYHQLSRAVSYANFGRLRFKTEYEQQLWGECARLITTCIIYNNALPLSNVLACKEGVGNIQGTALLEQISPIAW